MDWPSDRAAMILNCFEINDKLITKTTVKLTKNNNKKKILFKSVKNYSNHSIFSVPPLRHGRESRLLFIIIIKPAHANVRAPTVPV